MIEVKLTDIDMALEFASFSSFTDSEAFLCLKTGKIYYSSDLIDEEEEPLPDDIYDDKKYIPIPSKQELDLGRSLVLEFMGKYLSSDYELVYSMFRKSGAYSRYKDYLLKVNKLDEWHQYENQAQIDALKDWCSSNNIKCI